MVYVPTELRLDEAGDPVVENLESTSENLAVNPSSAPSQLGGFPQAH